MNSEELAVRVREAEAAKSDAIAAIRIHPSSLGEFVMRVLTGGGVVLDGHAVFPGEKWAVPIIADYAVQPGVVWRLGELAEARHRVWLEKQAVDAAASLADALRVSLPPDGWRLALWRRRRGVRS